MTGHADTIYRFPNGRWCCTRPTATKPCGDCDGCRYVATVNLNERAIRAKAAATTNPIYARKLGRFIRLIDWAWKP